MVGWSTGAIIFFFKIIFLSKLQPHNNIMLILNRIKQWGIYRFRLGDLVQGLESFNCSFEDIRSRGGNTGHDSFFFIQFDAN